MATDLIRYDLLVQDALRSVVRRVLSETARTGLPGDHHFNIAFKTQAAGVVAPPAIKARFPDEMSIILQHEFWDLVVTQDAFEVSLNFSRKPERLIVPFDAITGFTDPSVPFGFKLEPRAASESSVPSARPAPQHGLKPAPEVKAAPGPEARPGPEAKPAVPRAPAAKGAESAKATRNGDNAAAGAKKEAEPPSVAKVVSIDAFRKK